MPLAYEVEECGNILEYSFSLSRTMRDNSFLQVICLKEN